MPDPSHPFDQPPARQVTTSPPNIDTLQGMYVGGGRFIHAPHTGSVVKFDSMSNPWYVSHYVGGSRP